MFPVLCWGSLWLFCCRKSLSFSQTVSFSSPPFCNLVTQIDVPWRERFKVSDQCNLGCQTWSLHLHLLGTKSQLRLGAVFVFFVRYFVCSCSATPPICHHFWSQNSETTKTHLSFPPLSSLWWTKTGYVSLTCDLEMSFFFFQSWKWSDNTVNWGEYASLLFFFRNLAEPGKYVRPQK